MAVGPAWSLHYRVAVVMKFAPFLPVPRRPDPERPCLPRLSAFLLSGLRSGVAGAALALLPLAAQAQDVTSREVVQPLPSSEVQRLNRSLMQLARDPRDLAALLEAGEASLAVDDFDAATGFFTRAAAVAPEHPRASLGLARVYLRAGDAPQSLDQFDRALAAGVKPEDILAERSLALDLAGDQAGAQAGYRRALERDPSDSETRRRMALSFAIAGNRAGFEDTLRPLLDQRDPAALRTRAFGLAIFGDQQRAAAIVEQVMPRDLSSRLIPYLEFMPRLTRPQQAAAANLGIFPRAADIGRDDPRLARFAREAQADSRLQPSGTPLGTPRSTSGSARGGSGAAPSQPGVMPSSARGSRRSQQSARSGRTTPPPAATMPAVTSPAVTSPAQTTVVAAVSTVPTPSAAPPAAAPIAATPAAVAPAPIAATPVAAPPAPVLRVADAFADLGGALPDARAGGNAVDISKIEVRREVAAKPELKPEAKPKEPPKPVHPSRQWVQVATGRDVAALKFDWRRFERQSGDLFTGLKPHVTRWGQANRLLVGPVASPEKARALVKQLKEKGLESFAYASPEGEEIKELK
jgi:tetratricopeptide (TPR) repeat protein